MNDPFSNPRILDGNGRCACLLVIDTSGSNSGPNIIEVRRGLERFVECLRADAKTRACVEVAILTFAIEWDLKRMFALPPKIDLPQLMASEVDGTHLANAIEAAVDIVERRVDTYLDDGHAAYRPWMVLVSDATPTDSDADRRRAAVRLRRAAEDLHLMFCPVAVGKANKKILQDLAPERNVLQLEPKALVALFEWLTASVCGAPLDRTRTGATVGPSSNRSKWS